MQRTRNAYTNCSAGVILWMKQSDKKVSFDDPQNGGHFSCRKPVSHVGTSTVSDSEALIHLAYVQHMWQSKFVVILEGLTRWNWIVFKDAISWEMTTDAFWYACLLAGKKFCYAALTAKTFSNAPFLDPKMEVEKWTQKWCQNLTPKMGSKNGTAKGGPNILLVEKSSLQSFAKYWVSLLGAIFGPHVGGQILVTIFGTSILVRPPFIRLQKWTQRFCKCHCWSKLHSKTFSSK